jgi:serine/threonine protein kinase
MPVDETHPRTLDRSGDAPNGAAQWPVGIGDVVDGKYRIERQLGAGGMGIVMAARHLAVGEMVALKFLRLEHAEDHQLTERMKREALATFRLRSEHAVRAMDVGQLPSGSIYIVMELLEGEDLRAILRERGMLPETEAVSYALQVCDALEDAHALGIIHRDLKPQNLFLAAQPRGTRVLKVLDFGVSKLDPDRFDAAPMTGPGGVGTPRYMAPEQWSGLQTDARTDVWALGMILYEMLTGAVPNERRSPAERQMLLTAGAIQSPRALRPEVTAGVEQVVLRCLRPEPDRRWRSARRLALALREARPDVQLAPEGLPVTRSDVTAVDPSSHRAESLVRAFSRPASTRPVPVPTSQHATRRAAPASMPGYGQLPDAPLHETEAEVATEVSVPRFDPANYPPASAPAPARPAGVTLRSFEAIPEMPAREEPRPAPVPAPSVPPAGRGTTQPMAAAAHPPPPLASAPPPAAPPVYSVPPGPAAQAGPPSAMTVGIVALAVLGSLVVVLAIALAVVRVLASR